jgi:hypothetical protein
VEYFYKQLTIKYLQKNLAQTPRKTEHQLRENSCTKYEKQASTQEQIIPFTKFIASQMKLK